MMHRITQWPIALVHRWVEHPNWVLRRISQLTVLGALAIRVAVHGLGHPLDNQREKQEDFIETLASSPSLRDFVQARGLLRHWFGLVARTLLMVQAGDARLRELAPELAALVTAVQQRPEPLTAALAQTPVTFLHGDWKMGNLGAHPDGRTILVDCAYPGSGPPCWDLMWYLALNRARLPVAKTEVIAQFRAALDRRGWDTGGWFDHQLALCQLGMIVTFGWEKALGAGDPAGAAELDWWQHRALTAARQLDTAAPGWR